jgi:hypothetical protein
MNKRNLFCLVMIVCFCFQSALAIPKTSRYEFWWAFGHPFAALKVKHIYKKLKPFYNETELKLQLDNYSSGGKLDAFRHVFYMAAFAQKIKPKKVLKLGKAHEKTNYLQFKRNKNEEGALADSISGVMDLRNNEIGIKLGSENKKIGLDELKQKVLTLVKEEKAYYILIDSQGRFLDCNTHVIDLNLYKRKWFIPKCLLKRNVEL